MPRIRTIKPEFWHDEKLAPLDPITRLVFLGLVSLADDAGRLIDNVKAIDGSLFCETPDSSRDSLDILAGLSRITRYTSASGQRLIQIVHWERHQRVDRPNKYVLPGPPPQVAPPQGVTDDSREPRGNVAGLPQKSSVTTNDQRPTTNDQRPTTNDQRPTKTNTPRGDVPKAWAELNKLLPPTGPYGPQLADFVALYDQPIGAINTLANALQGVGTAGMRPVTADELLAAVNVAVSKWRGDGPPSTDYVLSCCNTILKRQFHARGTPPRADTDAPAEPARLLKRLTAGDAA